MFIITSGAIDYCPRFRTRNLPRGATPIALRSFYVAFIILSCFLLSTLSYVYIQPEDREMQFYQLEASSDLKEEQSPTSKTLLEEDDGSLEKEIPDSYLVTNVDRKTDKVYKRNTGSDAICSRLKLEPNFERVVCTKRQEEEDVGLNPIVDNILRNIEENLKRDRESANRAARQVPTLNKKLKSDLISNFHRELNLLTEAKRSQFLRRSKYLEQGGEKVAPVRSKGLYSSFSPEYIIADSNLLASNLPKLRLSLGRGQGGEIDNSEGAKMGRRQKNSYQSLGLLSSAPVNQLADSEGYRMMVLNRTFPVISKQQEQQQQQQQHSTSLTTEIDNSIPLGCQKRLFRFKAFKFDRSGNKCSGWVTANACYGGCDTGEFANHVFPYKKSVHKVCSHGKRLKRIAILNECNLSYPPASLRQYQYVDAEDCVCKTCSPMDTTCMVSMERPKAAGFLNKSSSEGTNRLSYDNLLYEGLALDQPAGSSSY